LESPPLEAKKEAGTKRCVSKVGVEEGAAFKKGFRRLYPHQQGKTSRGVERKKEGKRIQKGARRNGFSASDLSDQL